MQEGRISESQKPARGRATFLTSRHLSDGLTGSSSGAARNALRLASGVRNGCDGRNHFSAKPRVSLGFGINCVGTAVAQPRFVQTDLKARTKRFAIDVLHLSRELRPDSVGWLLRGQLIRAGTGVAANYRAACRGKSRSDFIAKMTTSEEEADETSYWLELLLACQAFPTERLQPLLQEADELTAIFVSSIKTARANRR